MARKFNYIYSTLVESEDDFIGKIAYTIYKEDKINFIAELKKDSPEKETTEKNQQHLFLKKETYIFTEN